MADAYLKDKRRVLPCAAYLRGEYGVKGMYVGVPCIIGAKGVEKVIEIKLDSGEKAMFLKSVRAVQSLIDATKKIRREATAKPAKKAKKKAPAKGKRKTAPRK